MRSRMAPLSARVSFPRLESRTMYLQHWKLRRRPFDDGPSPDFYFSGESHQASLLKLRYALEQRKGLALVVGEHGLGKTYLTQVLESELSESGKTQFIRLVFPQLSPAGMLEYLTRRLGGEIRPGSSDAELFAALEEQLAERHAAREQTVLVIDDAHLLEMPHLNVLRLLLNLREEGIADFSVILVGRTELLARVAQLAALNQRVSVRTTIAPLCPEEVLDYARHRLSVAGGGEPIFSEHAAETIWELSQGIPRRINQLCDLALLVGFVDQQHAITAVDVEAAAEELLSIAA